VEKEYEKLAYFARPVVNFGTEQDKKDIEMIESLGYTVIDITTPEVKLMYQLHGMSVFEPLVKKSSVVFFRAFLSGSIGAGVYKEVCWARDARKPVLELPTGVSDRALTVEQTRLKLRYND